MIDYLALKREAEAIGLIELVSVIHAAAGWRLTKDIDLACVLAIDAYLEEKQWCYNRGMEHRWRVMGSEAKKGVIRQTRQDAETVAINLDRRLKPPLALHRIEVGYGNKWSFSPIVVSKYLLKAEMELAA